MTEYIITGEQLERFGIPDLFTEQEIVRCRDCRVFLRWETQDGESLDYGRCRRYDETLTIDHFCAWGERKDVNE